MTYHAARHAGQPGGPLVLTFHGTGGDEQQFHALASKILPLAHVTSPRGDVSEHGALRYFRRSGEGVYDMADLARATAKMAGFIRAEKARSGAQRVIGLGYSNGANILAATAFADPELVDDLVLLHPLIPFDPAPQPGLAGRRVLVVAGEADPICPVAQTRALIRYLAAQGAEVSVHWHKGGHALPPDAYPTIAAFLA